jgi:hypothetical protein
VPCCAVPCRTSSVSRFSTCWLLVSAPKVTAAALTPARGFSTGCIEWRGASCAFPPSLPLTVAVVLFCAPSQAEGVSSSSPAYSSLAILMVFLCALFAVVWLVVMGISVHRTSVQLSATRKQAMATPTSSASTPTFAAGGRRQRVQRASVGEAPGKVDGPAVPEGGAVALGLVESPSLPSRDPAGGAGSRPAGVPSSPHAASVANPLFSRPTVVRVRRNSVEG